MQSIFICPPAQVSPRWQQAFANAVIYERLPLRVPPDALVWVFLDERGLDVLEQLRQRGISCVAMTAVESADQARAALAAGARGYVHYLAVAAQLEQVANVVTAGGLWLGVELMQQLVAATARQLPANPVVDLSSLTLRERLVAQAIAAGKSNKEAARELQITERTVKAHLGAVFEKLKVRDRLQLVLLLSGKS